MWRELAEVVKLKPIAKMYQRAMTIHDVARVPTRLLVAGNTLLSPCDDWAVSRSNYNNDSKRRL